MHISKFWDDDSIWLFLSSRFVPTKSYRKVIRWTKAKVRHLCGWCRWIGETACTFLLIRKGFFSSWKCNRKATFHSVFFLMRFKTCCTIYDRVFSFLRVLQFPHIQFFDVRWFFIRKKKQFTIENSTNPLLYIIFFDSHM